MVNVFILPGLFNSDPGHWQSLWEREHPEYHRVIQDDWITPKCADWVRRLDQVIVDNGPDTILVAHSTACALVGYWSIRCRRKIQGALLVAPSDTEAPSYPSGPTGFAPMPLYRLPFQTVVVASRNDPAVSFERAQFFAKSWGGELIDAGAAGHIETKSGYGPWSAGQMLLDELISRGRRRQSTRKGSIISVQGRVNM